MVSIYFKYSINITIIIFNLIVNKNNFNIIKNHARQIVLHGKKIIKYKKIYKSLFPISIAAFR